ncbi:MAG TPA: AAA family ATPase [Thermoanaerobacterales bacterium]|nr:AAA family ATPase [Thermoanaerobacterales bacterium]
MGLIKSLKLKNFQSHKESQIDFAEGLTVIIGQTDQGKSSIVRALKWVLYNEPRGTDFITAGSKLCRVMIEMENGSIIIRERDGQRNRYILIKNGEEQIFEGFGNSVPLEIIRAHGIPKIHIDRDTTSAVNLAEQLEAPFLISESGSNRAKALGRLVGIHIIDAAQRTTLKDLVDAQQRHKLLEKDIAALKDELAIYKDIEVIAEKISCLKNILEKLKQKRLRLSKLTQLKQELEPTDYEIEKNKNALLKLNFIDMAEKNIMFIDALYSKQQYLYELMKKLTQVTDSIKGEQEVINITKNLASVEDCYLTVLELNRNLNMMKNISQNLKNNNKDSKRTKTILSNTKDVFIADKTIFEAEKLLEVVKKYMAIYSQWESIDQQLNFQRKEMDRYVQIERSEHYLNDLLQKVSKLSLFQEIEKSMATVESSIKKGEAYLQQVIINVTAMAKEYSQMLKKFSICPTCLKPIDEETTQKIVSDILY